MLFQAEAMNQPIPPNALPPMTPTPPVQGEEMAAGREMDARDREADVPLEYALAHRE